MADRERLAWYVDQVKQSRQLVYEFCTKHGFTFWVSGANFVLARVGSPGWLDRVAAGRGRHSHPRQVGRPRVRRLHPRHDGHRRAHAPLPRRHGGDAVRRGVIDRKTNETEIRVALTLEGRGRYTVSTGIRFLDHMLELFARHGAFDLEIDAKGPRRRQHHTVEDLGIALGEAVSKALGDRRGINRAGYFVMPMDETLAVVALDLGGRPHAAVDLKVKVQRVGDLQSELVHDFFEGFAIGARANVHAKVLYGRSSHHHVEAIFKAFARALRVACSKDKQLAKALPSTKGLI
jgi:imidazoleglycerol-phosphate dehydratase